MKALGLVLGVVALGLSFAPWAAAPWAALLLASLAALGIEPAGRKRAWTGRTLLVTLLASGATAAVVAWANDVPAGLRAGFAMLVRLAVLVVMTSLAARHINHETWRRAFARLGLQRLGLVCGLALNAMPHLAEAWRDTWIALAVRRRRRHPHLADTLALVEAMLAHTGRIADEAAVAAALRGHLALAPRPAPLVGTPLVIVVTGRSGSGKTPAIGQLVDVLRRRDVPMFGFLQPPVWQGAHKVGFDLVDVRSGETAPLGRRVADGRGDHLTPFVFDPRGFALAHRALRLPPRGGVLIVDEIGPVELRGEGHWSDLARAWRTGRPMAAVLTLRRQLIPAFLALLDATEAIIVDAEVEPDLAGALLATLRSVLPQDGQHHELTGISRNPRADSA